MGLLPKIRLSRAKSIQPTPVPTEEPESHSPAMSSSASRRSSRYSNFPADDFRNSVWLEDIRYDVMINFLSKQQLEMEWMHEDSYDEGIVLKKARGLYTCFPENLREIPNGFYNAVTMLNVRAAMTVNTDAIRLVLGDVEDRVSVPLLGGLHLQVVPNMASLGYCQKHQFSAFIADSGLLVVWDDDPNFLVARASKLEKTLIEMSQLESLDYEDEKKRPFSIITKEVDGRSIAMTDVETGLLEEPRPTALFMAVISACTLLGSIAVMGLSWKEVVQEILIDKNYIRMAFLLILVPQLWVSFFFFQTIVIGLAQIVGPISQVYQNSKYYSGLRPNRLRGGNLPHVTIQMPVYREGLYTVIMPTIRSIKAAISTYEMQGGTANLFINDDGMQLLTPAEANARKDAYDENNVGWVARPPHNANPADGTSPFIRAGRFKKASNMNYAMWMSSEVEAKLTAYERDESWTTEDEARAYERALTEVMIGTSAWSEGNIRIGDYILLIDSDTRVPEDCFLDAVSELEASPQVAILQFISGVMNVTDSYFEKAFTFFTNLVYTQIKYQVACGDTVPFMGHNAFLRWSALQEISFEEDDRTKYWSEATVSEDFEMALRFQSQGFILRLASYQGDGFKEGVSLTVYDELSRWSKYAFGCSEIIFNPFRYWFTRSPLTKLFRTFLWTKGIPIASKVSILAYMGTYYAIALGWVLALVNYFMLGLFIGTVDRFYVEYFNIYFAVIIAFGALGQVALAVLRYRTGEKGFFASLLENLSWIPVLYIFIGGISLHVSQALCSHLVSLNMTWGATTKEAVDTTFFKEIPKVLRQFKGTLIFCVLCSGMMVAMAQFVPDFWRIDLFVCIYPLTSVVLTHFLLPLALNPGLMRFSW